MKAYILISMSSIILLFMILNVSADLGSFPQYQCISLKTILNTNNVTLASITYPNGTSISVNQLMNKSGLVFTYRFCNTVKIGKYIYDYYDAEFKVYENSFFIKGDTENKGLFNFDLTSTIGIIFFLVMLLIAVVMLFFEETNMYGSILFVICGFIVMYSGISLIFAVVLILIGAISMYVIKR